MFADQVQKLLDSGAEVAVKQPEAISLLNSVYKQLFGEGVKKECGDCLTKALLRVRKYVYLQSQNSENFNLETMKKFEDKNFVLAKGKALDVGKIGVILTNDSMTDEDAVRALVAFPNLIKYFEKYPTDEEGNLDLSGFESKTKKDKKGDQLSEQQKNADAAKKLADSKSPVIPAVVPEVKQEPVVPAAKNTEAKTVKAAPGKAPANRLPNAGETIDQAAERHGVSSRTIERDMKAAGINVTSWKIQTAPKEGQDEIKSPVIPAVVPEVKQEPVSDPNPEAGAEGQEGKEDDDNSGYVDFEVTQEWLDANKEDAEANDIKLGDIIEIEKPAESSTEGE